MAKASSSFRTFVPRLTPAAVRFNINPHLKDVTLASILTGDTCAPISLADFEKHLAFVEHSVENLQFLDYRERYLRVFRDPTSPSSSEFVFGAPSPVKTEERAAESIVKLGKARTGDNNDPDLPPSPTSPKDVASPMSLSSILPPQYTKHTIPTLSFTGSTNESDANTFHTDCLRAIATFLTPGSAKELSLDSVVRDTAIRTLSLGSHPDAFLPVYEEIYSQVEQCSLPRFLASASANINLPKQIYWYAVGMFNMTFGLLIALLLILLVPTPPQAYRAFRIFGVGFFAFGVGQVYSAWRGQVWLRGATQLRVWEMQDMDIEAKNFVEGILGEHQGPPRSPLEEKNLHSPENNISTIAPFSLASQMKAGRSSVSTDAAPSFGAETISRPRHNFNRPPIFGPEAVVLDPRINAVHRQVIIDILQWAVVTAVVGSLGNSASKHTFDFLFVMQAFGAIVFSAPSRAHPRS
ncbi:hypothetical protein H0H87_011100 [Tephrocybe sp. NHM501043]|nr:hypothetical protein H0H87_011100 [Tephrocybe sp. NHM501043]